MRTEDGRVTTDGTRIVATLARHLAETSKLPLTEATATDHLCAATTGRVPATTAASVGSPTIPPEEITKALTQTPSGKSPGPDGIPADLYRELASTFAPAFQALFETILRDGAPPGFNDGLVVTLYKKKGDPLSPGNYRPITLLNTDYKLFAKVFANRLIPALDPLVNQEQTAFLPGRYIGNNVRLLRELQAWAATHELGLGTVLCDFAKAYDTVSRDTLRRLFQTVGLAAAEPFLAVLMTNTTSRCHANGYLSRRFSLEAGVRQGCPASPLIYLVLAYALHCHLRGTRLGPTLFVVDTATRSCKPRLQVGPQFADDLDALIRTRSQIPRFLEGMQQFAAATGQHLNVAKTQLLYLGHPDYAPPGPTEHGLAVMPASTTVLGTPLGNPPAAFWTDKVAATVAEAHRAPRYVHVRQGPGRQHLRLCSRSLPDGLPPPAIRHRRHPRCSSPAAHQRHGPDQLPEVPRLQAGDPERQPTARRLRAAPPAGPPAGAADQAGRHRPVGPRHPLGRPAPGPALRSDAQGRQLAQPRRRCRSHG